MPVSFIKRLGVKLSLNDPRWGHDPKAGRKAEENKRPGNNDGPPDLDQLWRDFNQRLNRIFNKRNEGGGGGPYRPDARGVGITAGVVGGIAALIHGVLPFLFTTTGSRTITALHAEIVAKRAHETEQRSVEFVI